VISVCQVQGLVLVLLVYPFEAFFKYSSLEHISAEVLLGVVAHYLQSRASPSSPSLQKRLLMWSGGWSWQYSLTGVWKVLKDNFSFLTIEEKDPDFVFIALKNSHTLHLSLFKITGSGYS